MFLQGCLRGCLLFLFLEGPLNLNIPFIYTDGDKKKFVMNPFNPSIWSKTNLSVPKILNKKISSDDTS